MARVRLLPHRQILASAVTWGDWWVRINDQRLLAGARVQDWDYATPLSFELQPSVDVDVALESSGLTADSDIDVVLLAESPTTGRRFTSARNLVDLAGDGGVLTLKLPPKEIARFITLSAFLVLSNTKSPDDDTAWKRGARLAQSDRSTVWLEGDAPRFPTEAVAFSALGLEPALWDLDVSYTDLDESFLATVRLLVNTEHPSAESLLDESDPGFPAIRSVLELDIARRLILSVANDEGLRTDLSRRKWHEGSVREALEQMADGVLGSDLSSLAQLSEHDPRRFERRLQHSFDFLAGRR